MQVSKIKKDVSINVFERHLTLTILDVTPTIEPANSGCDTVLILTASKGASKKQQQKPDVAALAATNGISYDDKNEAALISVKVD